MAEYNAQSDEASAPSIVVIVDELADLMMDGKEVEDAIIPPWTEQAGSGIHT